MDLMGLKDVMESKATMTDEEFEVGDDLASPRLALAEQVMDRTYCCTWDIRANKS